MRKRTLRIRKNRRYTITLRCPPSAGSRCEGIVRVVRGKNRVSRRSFSVTASRYRRVGLRMTKRDFRSLRRNGRLRVTVVVTTRDDAGTLRRKAVRLIAKPTKAAAR